MGEAKAGEGACEIFLSYRRDDVPFAALMLYRALEDRFGKGSVFLDVEMRAMEPFPAKIQAALDGALIVCVLIGKHWFDGDGPDNVQRIADPRDWVHREVRYALDHGKALPVLVSRHEWPVEAAFPEPLRPLVSLSSKFQIQAAHWERDFPWFATKLAKLLEERREDAIGAPALEPAHGLRSIAEDLPYPEASLASEWRSWVLEALGRSRLAHQPVSLVEVYVESGLHARDARQGESVGSLLELLSRVRSSAAFPRCWVLFGDPGSGKSTVLRHAATRLTEQEDAVPVYVSLAVWSRELRREDRGEEPRSIWRFAAERVQPDRAEQLERYLESERDAGRVVLLLDGFDEVAPHLQPRMRAWIEALCRVDGLPVVIASRPIGQGGLTDLALLRVAEVQPLSPTQQAELIGKWLPDERARAAFLERLRDTPPLRRLAPNPLLLSLMGWVADRRGVDKLPATLTLLHDEILQQIVEVGYKTPDAVAEKVGFELSVTVVEALGEIALGLLLDRDHDAVWPRSVIVEAIGRLPDDTRRALGEATATGGEAFVIDLARTGLWSESEGAGLGYRFLHRSLGEALAAKALSRRVADPAGQRWVLQLGSRVAGEEARWAEVFALFVARVSKGDSNAADHWLLRLAEANPVLARRALCWVDHASPETVEKLLDLPGDDLDRRCALFGQIEELVGDLAGAARLLGRLAARTADCQELWFLAKALDRIAGDPRVGKEAQDEAADALSKKLFACGFGQQRPELEWCEIREQFRSFEMGSPEDEVGRSSDEGPLHHVVIEKPYWLAATPITNAQWKRFRSEHPEDDDRPVVNVTWFEAAMYCRWLGARLPSEAEWECAARSGTTTRFCSGDADGDLDDFGWYGSDARGLMPVGQKKPNASGLRDMHGNVWEWCEDRWHGSYKGAPDDGGAWVDDGPPSRVMRGGSFLFDAGGCRSAFRWFRLPRARDDALGLRPASSSLSNLTTSPPPEPSPD